MNPTTQDRIRKAAQDALADRDDASALELLSLLAGIAPARIERSSIAALPPGRQVTEGPAHDHHYWVRFVREHFIPFMIENGRAKFTSPELLSWIEHHETVPMTTGDTSPGDGGREAWRSYVSDALASLKRMGVLTAAPFSKDYSISQNLLLNRA
jgi:hypothetical protein